MSLNDKEWAVQSWTPTPALDKWAAEQAERVRAALEAPAMPDGFDDDDF